MAAKSTRPKAARAAAYSTPSADPRPGGVAKAFYVEISRKGGAPAPPPQRAAARTPARSPALAAASSMNLE